ncbi:MAG: hypothetical protein AB7G93_22655 [Bdellovibrionales bacterium]
MDDIERLKAGAEDLLKRRSDLERKIRREVESELGDLDADAQDAVIQSRLKVLENPGRPKLVQVDLGENAGKNSKKDLFE